MLAERDTPQEILDAGRLDDPAQGLVLGELPLVRHPATPLPRVGFDGEPIDLNGDDVRIREGLEADEAAILGAQYAPLEVGEVVELAKLLRLVGVVEVADEPVRGVTQDVALDRADLLRRIHHADPVLRALLRRTDPDVFQVQLDRGREDVVGLLNVDEDVRWVLCCAELAWLPSKMRRMMRSAEDLLSSGSPLD